jgi:hypothetical protein
MGTIHCIIFTHLSQILSMQSKLQLGNIQGQQLLSHFIVIAYLHDLHLYIATFYHNSWTFLRLIHI